MATVPVLDIPTVDLQPSNVVQFQAPGVEPMRNAAPEQMQNLGKATMQAAVTLKTIGDRIQDELDDAATKEADNLLSDQLRASIYNPDTGYLATVGKKALDARQAAIDGMNDAKQKFSQTLTSEMQRKMFNQVASRRLQTAMTQVDSHAMQQAKVYNIGESKARVTASVQDAVANASSWNMKDADGKVSGPYSLYKETAISEINSLADIMGLPAGSSQRKELVLSATTQIASEVVKGMVANNQATEAREYLASVIKSKEVNPTNVDELQNLVKTAGLKDESLRLSMTVKGSLTEQLNTVDQMFKDGKISAEVRDATAQRFQNDYTVKKTIENDGNKAMLGTFQDWIIKNPGRPIINAPPELYSWAKAHGQLAELDRYAGRGGGAGDRLDELKERGIMLQLSIDDPENFLKQFKENGFLNRMTLGNAGIRELQNIAISMLQNNGKRKVVFDSKILQDAIPAAINKPGAANKEKKDAFVAITAEASARWIAANPGKTPDAAAYGSVLTEANQEWIGIGAMWNDDFKAYEARGKEGKFVPKAFYDGAKAKGATKSEIYRMWIRHQAQQERQR